MERRDSFMQTIEYPVLTDRLSKMVPVEVRLCNAYFECLRAINVGEPVSPDKKSEYASQFLRWTGVLTGNGDMKQVQQEKKGFSLFGKKKD